MDMRTAKEMDDYSLEKGFSAADKSALKHFSLIEKQLKPDENVKCAMTAFGVYNGQRAVMGGITAIAFTNMRLIYAQKGGFLFGEQVKIVNLNQVNDIEKAPFGIAYGRISIDTIKENIGIDIDKKKIDAVFNAITEIIDDYKSASGVISQPVSDVEELKKFKELFDSGVITEEEYNKKKSQILGF